MPRRAALMLAASAILVVGFAAALLVGARDRSGAQIDAFARAPVGCSTTVRLERAGEYFVYAELGAEPVERAGCVPAADPTARFDVDVDGVVTVPDDRTITYSRGVVSAASVRRLVVTEPTEIVVTVVGSDPGVVAAIGPDPAAGVERRRALAMVVGATSLILGGGLLIAAGRSGPDTGRDADELASWAPPLPRERMG